MYSGGMYHTFSSDMIKMSEYIKNNTDAHDIFLTSTSHINPISSLSGRNIYVGSSIYLYFHGYGDEYTERSNEVREAYQGSYEELIDFCKNNNIKYIYVGDYELNDYEIQNETLEKLEKVISFGKENLYKVV